MGRHPEQINYMDISQIELITSNLTPWHWMTAGLLICAVELFAPTTILLWPGVAAIATGVITLLLPEMSWQIQVALFAFLAVATTFAGRQFYKNKPDSGGSSLNRPADKLIGRKITVIDAITNGVGGTFIDGNRWRVVGPDTDAGAVMEVVAMDGSSLVVEPETPASQT